jgi:triosephosphate isomerase
MRRKIIAGNWKMNGDQHTAKSLLQSINSPNNSQIEVLVFPPFLFIEGLLKMDKLKIKIGAQNVSQYDNGAYTGEISAEMLKNLGVDVVLVGHSERREYFSESPEILKSKVDISLSFGIEVVFCCGEPIEVRNSEKHISYVVDQLRSSIGHLSKEMMGKIKIAYEPIWAIGTGLTATAEQAQGMHHAIRSFVTNHWDSELGAAIHILYGGSLKADNAPDLLSMKDIDGGLIGGASLKADEFNKIIEIATSHI